MRIQPCSGDCSEVRSRRPSSRRASFSDVLGHAGVVDLLAVLLDDVLLAVLAELLADRAHLLAQQELALALLHALADVGADLVLQLQVGEHVLRPAQDQLEARLDVERLQHLDLLLDREVGRVAGGVGHGAGLRDAAQELGDGGDAARLDDVLDHRPVLAGELRLSFGRRAVERRLDLDPRGLAGPGHAQADGGTVQAADHERLGAVAQAADVLDLRDGADPGVAVVHARDEQQLAAVGGVDGRAGLVGFDREGHDHPGEHDPGGQREEGEDLGIDVSHRMRLLRGHMAWNGRSPRRYSRL